MTTEVLHPMLAEVARFALGDEPSKPVQASTRRSVSRRDQAKLLGRIRELDGPSGLLLAGGNLEKIAGEPILLALLNSETPGVLLEKIESLNRYLHSAHHHVVHALTEDSLDIEHRSTSGDPPSCDESLFVCGLYLWLLDAIGCNGVTCSFPESDAPDHHAYQAGRVERVPSAGTARWRIRWTAHTPTRVLHGLDRVLLRDLPLDLTDHSVTVSVAMVLRSDLTRSWRLVDVAARIDMAPRTLQRRLREADTTFTRVVDATRIAAAKELLRDPTSSVTDVGYLTGFADTAHFSRSFRRSTGHAPTRWREQEPAG